MPILPNAKHEAFAFGLSRGMSANAAYERAGFTPNRGNARRLKANEAVRKRVLELQEANARAAYEATVKAATFAAINVREQMRIMLDIINEAREAQDYKTAADGQKFVLTCFGYADSPTLTHEHMAEKPLDSDEAQAVGQDRDTGNVLRFGKVLGELRKRAK